MKLLEPILWFGAGLFALGLMLVVSLYVWFWTGKRFKKDRIKLSKRYPHLPDNHIANCKIGDCVNTPGGHCIVTESNELRFSAKHIDKKSNIGYGNVPYFEGGNNNVFYIITHA